MLDYNVTYRKKDKGIQCIISYKDNTGKWKQKSKQGFKTQKDAKPYIQNTVRELEGTLLQQKGIISTDYNLITFKQLSYEFIEHEKLYREYNTTRNHKIAFKRFTDLNDKKISSLKKIDIRKMPQISFHYDNSYEYGRNIEEKIKEIHKKENK